jgi:sterol desaturase/sphingolipid hydroxylase (fatty acid hydroxylase superfamily)
VTPNYIALAVPFFFLLIGIELLVARRRGRRVYRLNDALSDLGCGITQQTLLIFFNAFLLATYVWLYQHVRVVDLGRRPIAAWVVAFVGVDFIYYWWHRASHRVNLMWAAHAVHHQSEDYNLAVALRQAVLTPFTSLPFSLPMAMLGIPPLIYVAAEAFSTLYQFWIHTELVGRLGPLEQVFNTPSHHRVHHARNPRYIDRNYGAVLIVWDRLFGTYAQEREPPIYGLTRPLRSFNSLWAQCSPLWELGGWMRRAPRMRDRLRVWLAPPERRFAWVPDLTAPGGKLAMDAPKFDVAMSRPLGLYVIVNFAIAVVATFLLMLWGQSLPHATLIGGAALVLLAMLSIGGLVEARRWARPLEIARVALTTFALVLLALRVF